MVILKKFRDWKIGIKLGSFLGRELVRTAIKEMWIELPTHRVYAHIHTPAEAGKHPGIIIVPGANSPGTDYDKGVSLRASEIASCGFTVLHYDPFGRGKSDGKEDYWGYNHQRELVDVVHYFSNLPEVDPEDIGILSFSIGIIIAVGALAKFDIPEVRYLFDWEGPSNRFNITRNDTHGPLKDFPTSKNEFWNEREAARFICEIECGYFRYQAEKDHMQENYKGHAIELLNNATNGRASWTRCNENPVNTFFDEKKINEYNWVSVPLNHKGQILKYLLELQR